MTGVIESSGALGVFLLMVPESACVPLPSEVTLLFSGFAVHQGWMSFPLAVLAATAGNLVGSLIAYGLGVTGWVARVPGGRRILSRWEGLLDRHGTRAVFVARLLPLARTFVSLPAGARRVPLAPFIALTTLGCALWATAFVLTGVIAGTAWATVSSVAGRAMLVLGLSAVALSLVRRRRQRQSTTTSRDPAPGATSRPRPAHGRLLSAERPSAGRAARCWHPRVRRGR